MTLNMKDLAIIESQEEELWREETRFDIGRMRELLAGDFREVGRSGKTYTLEDTLSLERCSFRCRLPLPDFTITSISADVALVTYISEVSYGEAPLYARRSSLWLRAGERWILKFHQGTPYE